MARRTGYFAEKQREIERERIQAERAQRALDRERAREERELKRLAATEEREAKKAYVEARQREAEVLNHEIQKRLAGLETLLATTLRVDDYIDLQTLKPFWNEPRFDGGVLSQATPEPAQDVIEEPRGLKAAVPGAKKRHAQAVAEAQQRYATELAHWRASELEREQKYNQALQVFDVGVAVKRAAHDDEVARVDAFEKALAEGDPGALVDYFGLVLSASHYPEYINTSHRLAYVPESRQLVAEVELPTLDVVPSENVFRYVKARDKITSSARTAKDRKDRYTSAIAQISLRTVHELIEADRRGWVDTVVFNGYVDSIDPRTGRATRPVLISLRTTRDRFTELDLARVDPQACLRYLSAAVSKSPTELAPVKPVLEFDMVDTRFVDESDVLSGLDSRPNLMDLTPGEFESLITNLFEKMGLETRQTQASRDGGVDCVAFDNRPIFGGKVVIQAKRYKHTVGVSAVRDLYGTVQNEGASKGILVTTSGYGTSSFTFAEGKPLELLSGSNLLYLLEEHAGLTARIEPPEEWVDPDGAIIEY